VIYASLRFIYEKCEIIIKKTSLLTTAGSRPGTRVVCRWLKRGTQCLAGSILTGRRRTFQPLWENAQQDTSYRLSTHGRGRACQNRCNAR